MHPDASSKTTNSVRTCGCYQEYIRTRGYAPSSAQVTSAGLGWAQLNATQPKRLFTERRATQSIQTKPSMTQCARPKQRTPQILSCQTWRYSNLFALTVAQPMGYIGYKKSTIACVSCRAFQSSGTFFFIETHKSNLGYGRKRTCPLQLSQLFSTTAWLYFR